MSVAAPVAVVPPEFRIDRVRLGTTVFGVVLCLLPLGPTVASADGARTVLTVVSGAVIIAILILTHIRRGHVPLVLIPVTAFLLCLMGIGLIAPQTVMSPCLGLVAAATMYGSRGSILLRVGCLLPVLPLAAHFSLATSDVTASASASAIPVIVLFTGLIYLLRNTLESQAITISREGFMARLDGGLLSATSVEDVVEAMVRANHELDQVSPGLITLELIRVAPGEPGPPDGARMLNAHGADRSTLPQYLPAAALAELPPIGVDREMPLRSGSAVLTELGLPPRKWHAVALERLPGAPCDLILHGVQVSLGQKLFGVLTPEEREFLDVMARKRRHWRSAMGRVLLRQALVDAEERDSVTGLPDRSLIMRRIIELVQRNQRQAGLVILEIAGLDDVEADSGIAGSDIAMTQLGSRISTVVDRSGEVGRSGDSSFAVLLPSVHSPEQVEELVDRLADVILEPVLTPAGPVQLSFHVGVARTTEGGTAADLLERAASALAVDRAGRRDTAEAFEVGQG